MGRKVPGWTSREVELLRQNAHLGARTLAEMLGRSVGSVEQQAHRQRISLRQEGSRRGPLLGQPRGTSFVDYRRSFYAAPRMREDALAGKVDLAVLEAQVIRMVREGTRPLCPSCGKREQTVNSTGLCSPCHLRRLAAAHLDRIAETEAQRNLDSARQQAKRARDRKEVR